MKKKAPYPIEQYPTKEQCKAARYRYCKAKCQAQYMKCLEDLEKKLKPVQIVIAVPIGIGIGIGIGVGIAGPVGGLCGLPAPAF